MRPGDLLFTHRTGLLSKAIAFGQGLRHRGRSTRWTHVAVIVGPGMVVEALGRHGVQRGSWGKYSGVEHEFVAVKAEAHDRAQIVAFAEACVGREYGFAQVVSLAITSVTGGSYGFGSSTTLICSGLAAEALTRAGYIFDRDPSRMTPYDLRIAL